MAKISSFISAALAVLVFSSPVSRVSAGDAPYIPVGSARTKKTVIAFPSIRVAQAGKAGTYAHTIEDTINNDLNFMDIFKMLSPSAFLEDPTKTGLTLDSFKMTDWSGVGADFLVKSSLQVDPAGNLVFEAYLYDAHGVKQVLAKRFVAAAGDVKTLAHTFANQIVEALTGLPGIFLTKIAMSCDRTHNKEIYVMNYDGTEVKQITHHASISFAPGWSPDGTRLAYSLYARHKNNVKNIDLYEFNFKDNTIRLLSNRKGINSGAAYSPNGDKIALTMSFLGNPEIFFLDLSNNSVARVVHSMGFDVDPTWSPDGKNLAFVSNRTGIPMVFSTSIDGSKVQRLTYAGRYNATPTWSPANNKIAFAGWIDKHFDIFIMNPDGTNIERLTKDQGNNEDPSFSPDGNFIVFSSNRGGQQSAYVMNIDGTFVKRLTYGLGNCVAPKWSNPPRNAPSQTPVASDGGGGTSPASVGPASADPVAPPPTAPAGQ